MSDEETTTEAAEATTINFEELRDEFLRLREQVQTTAADQLTVLARVVQEADELLFLSMVELLNEVLGLRRVLAGMAGQDAEGLEPADPGAMLAQWREQVGLLNMIAGVDHLRRLAGPRLVVPK